VVAGHDVGVEADAGHQAEPPAVGRAWISSAESVPVQLDGDPGGIVAHDGAWSAEVIPRAIDVLVPATYPLAS
jgi:diacylglycerol kinase family enzyme